MIKSKKEVILKGYFVGVILILVGVGILYKLIELQHNPEVKEKFEEFAQRTNFKTAKIPASRGNLYATDGSLLATTIRQYNIAIDGKAMRQSLIDSQLDALSDSLSKLLGKPSKYYSKLILDAKRKNKQYVPIAKKLEHKDLVRMRNFPIFKQGQIKGGFIVEDILIRDKSVGDIGARTLGYVTDKVKVGLEGAYDSLLAGKPGMRLEQRMGGGNWRPIELSTAVEAEEGFDVVTTIDIELQDVAYNALKETLVNYEAHHGCAIVMDVATGEIRAIVNLAKMKDGSYADTQNFAVGEANEPGSTIKTISLLAAIKDKKIDTTTTVATGGGARRLYGRVIHDTHANGTITAKQVLEKSSNIGTALLISNNYQKDPDDFIDILIDDWKLDKPLGVDIPGEAMPYIPHPDNKSWSKQSLASVSYGYESKLTPLQILTFYNGIANDGTMLKPLFVKEIRKRGKLIKKYDPVVRVKEMADISSIRQIQAMLAGTVKQGTGRRLYIPDFPAAGKTGTTRAEYWIKNQGRQYRASFCGYFPTYKPKYSCIVVIHKPKTSLGYYGSTVAGSVFKKILQKVFITTPKDYIPEDKNQPPYKAKIPNFKLDNKLTKVPNLIGKAGFDVIAELENAGLIVQHTGTGYIIDQKPLPGQPIKDNIIELTLDDL